MIAQSVMLSRVGEANPAKGVIAGGSVVRPVVFGKVAAQAIHRWNACVLLNVHGLHMGTERGFIAPLLPEHVAIVVEKGLVDAAGFRSPLT